MNGSQRKIVEGVTSLVEGLLEKALVNTPERLVCLNDANGIIELTQTPLYTSFFPKDQYKRLLIEYDLTQSKMEIQNNTK